MFIKNLASISIALKKMKKQERQIKLTQYLRRANKFAKKTRDKYPEVDYCQGIILPFGVSYDEQGSVGSNVIMRINEEDFICFETKMRVPYRVVLETVE